MNVETNSDALTMTSNNLTENERERCRKFFTSFGYKTSLSVLTHPFLFAKTLFQLGYEPYALTAGKIFIVMGRNTYFLPNAFIYLRQISRDHGVKVIFSGLDAAIVSNAINGIVSFTASLYLDRYFLDVGGNPENLNKLENELSHHQSARIKIRQAIRDTISHTFAIVACRPFTVVMVREIAQLVGGETKYPNLLQSILKIGNEEGICGFFSGLVPCLLADYIAIWGLTSVRYVADRIIEHLHQNKKEENVQILSKDMRSVLDVFIPIAVNSFCYPFQVVSTVMAASGSGLAVSLLPYSPIFMHWDDAYNYLKPYGLTRGARLFLREQKGAISVGANHQLYASNKHFI